jgi:hypothetical protein
MAEGLGAGRQAVIAAGGVAAVLGLYWDDAWHTDVGRDDLPGWSPGPPARPGRMTQGRGWRSPPCRCKRCGRRMSSSSPSRGTTARDGHR